MYNNVYILKTTAVVQWYNIKNNNYAKVNKTIIIFTNILHNIIIYRYTHKFIIVVLHSGLVVFVLYIIYTVVFRPHVYITIYNIVLLFR